MIRCDGIDRREVIRIGGLTALGLGLGNFAKLRHAAAVSASRPPASAKTRSVTNSRDSGRAKQTAKSCILVWLDGGPSHIETFDPKPLAPSEVRGPFAAISTAVPGVELSELMPGLASRMKDLAIVRSMTSSLGEYNFGTHYLQTGFKPSAALEYPSFHAVSASIFDQISALPANIAVPNFSVGGSSFSGNGFLDSQFAPFSIGADPAKPSFKVKDLDLYRGISLARMKHRNDLVNQLDRLNGFAEADAASSLQQAFRMVNSKQAREAFDVAAEPEAVRNRYGRRTVGQSCLLARRLVERGVPFVTVNHKGWDTHTDLTTRLKDGFTGAQKPVGLVPSLDLAVSALIDDLKDRSMLDETLVVVMGEFGRTPKLNSAGGRDHWPRAFSVVMAGGGIVGGQVVGASDSVGESPKLRPTSPGDLVATIYSLLGIDPALELKTTDGRPVRITSHDSKVISELLS